MPGGVRAAQGIDHGFATNAVDFIADDRMHGPGATFDGDAKINLSLDSELLLDAGECLFDIKRVSAGRRAEAAQRLPAFFDDLPQDMQDMGERCARRQIFGQAINCDMQLHRSADDALQQCVVEFLCDARALGEPFFKAQVQSPSRLV